jgi:hypothetical protein
MTTLEVWSEQNVGYIVASRGVSWIGGGGNDGQAATSFVAPTRHDRRAISGVDVRRDENSSLGSGIEGALLAGPNGPTSVT